jgi:predicted RNA-binding Zn-ribbon protein involved in translation (DUF1610 family)
MNKRKNNEIKIECLRDKEYQIKLKFGSFSGTGIYQGYYNAKNKLNKFLKDIIEKNYVLKIEKEIFDINKNEIADIKNCFHSEIYLKNSRIYCSICNAEINPCELCKNKGKEVYCNKCNFNEDNFKMNLYERQN